VSCRPVAAVFAALLMVLAGCSQQTEGNPTAADTPTSQESTTEQTTEETTESSEPGDAGLADIEPCGLLDDSDLAALQLTLEGEKTSGTRGCNYSRQGATINESFAVGISLYDDQGLADLNAENIQPLPNIGSHEAASFTELSGDCGIAIVVTDTSRVDVGATGGDVQQGCQLTTQLATVVEPKLP
jgi:hypothetical protein